MGNGTLIIGGGLAGLSAGWHLGRAATLLEASSTVGGLCRSYRREGYTFDISGHLLHFRRPEIRRFVASRIPGALARHRRRAFVHFHGRLVHYPFQAHLFELPARVRDECLRGFFAAAGEKEAGAATPGDFEGWLRHHFGEGIVKHFLGPYNRKMWRVPLAPDRPGLGFVGGPGADAGTGPGGRRGPGRICNSGTTRSFTTRARAEIGVLAAALARGEMRLHLGEKVVGVDLRRRRVETISGRTWEFERLVSTAPLPELLRMTRGLSPAASAAAERLRCVSICIANVGLARPAAQHGALALFPGAGVPLLPGGDHDERRPGDGAVRVPRPLRRGDAPVRGPRGLRASAGAASAAGSSGPACSGAARSRPFVDLVHVPCAYVLYDRHRAKVLPGILRELESRGVHSIGRYGAWEYGTMEDALWQGRETARRHQLRSGHDPCRPHHHQARTGRGPGEHALHARPPRSGAFFRAARHPPGRVARRRRPARTAGTTSVSSGPWCARCVPRRDGVALASARRASCGGRCARRVGRVGAGTPPVIVHTHSSKAGILGRAAARIAGVPVVVHTVHGFGFHPRQSPGVRRFYIALERLAARWTNHVIAVAQADLDEGVALGIFDRERASLIRSGIEIARYAGSGDRPGCGCPRPRVRPGAAAGRDGGLPQTAEEPRGFRPGRRARRRRKSRVRSFSSPATGCCAPRSRRRCGGPGLGGRLRLLGWRRDVDAIIPCLDVLVLTSLWEGLPRVFPQAMAAGRPIVAYRVDERAGGGDGGRHRPSGRARRLRRRRGADRRPAARPGARAADGGGGTRAGRGVRRGPDGAPPGRPLLPALGRGRISGPGAPDVTGRRPLLIVFALGAAWLTGEAAVRVVSNFVPEVRYLSTMRVRSRPRHSPTLDSFLEAQAHLVPHRNWRNYYTNSLGFNDAEFEIPKPPGRYRIVALGDSFCFSMAPYPDAVQTLIEKHLSGPCNRDLDLLNAGVPAVGLWEYRELFELLLPAWRPDAVVLHLYLGNDGPDLFRQQDDLPFREEPVVHSALLTYLRNAVKILRSRGTSPGTRPPPRRRHPDRVREKGGEVVDPALLPVSDQAPELAGPLFSVEAFLEIMAVEFGRFYVPEGGSDRAWKPFVGILEDMRRKAAGAGVRFVIVLYPSLLQIYPDLSGELLPAVRELREYRHLAAGRIDLMAPNRYLLDWCARSGADCYDLTPHLAREAQQQAGSLYTGRDTHWNILGNRLAAAGEAAFLEQALCDQNVDGPASSPR